MIQKPNREIIHTTDVYHQLVRAVALLGMCNKNELESIKNWILDAGMEDEELAACNALIDFNLKDWEDENLD